MELVYLWVEDYKNIHHQEFNFSPKFWCEYDPDSNELTIDKKDDYIENFFGENINVTAIVGKNGSGKSNVLYSLIEIIDFIITQIQSEKVNFIICYIMDDTQILATNITIMNEKELPFSFKKIDKNASSDPFILLHYDSSLNYFQRYSPLVTQGNFNPYIHTDTQVYYTDIYLFPRKDIPIDQLHKEEIKNIILYIKNSDKLIGNFFEPSQVFIHPLDNSTCNYCNDFESFEVYNLENYLIQLLEDALEKINEEDVRETLLPPHTVNDPIYIMGNYPLSEIIESLKHSVDLKQINNILKDQLNPINNNIYINSLDWSIRENIEHKIQELSKYIDNSLTIDNKNQLIIKENNVFKIDKDYLNDFTIDFLLSMQPFFDIYVYDDIKKVSYKDLSSGEKELLRIRFYIENIIREKKQLHKKYMILLDEPSNAMHPDWQKKLLDYLVKIFGDRDIHIQFILTSHSPFLLSDLPKQNIIFLDTYKEEDEEVKNGKQKIGNCKVVDGLSQTFGANIHTLLSDSFFMDKGLMGEFAKKKIQEIMDFLNNKKSIDEISIKEKDIKQVIESIGEPFLREKLLSMYYKKYSNEKKQKIKKLEEELKRLKYD